MPFLRSLFLSLILAAATFLTPGAAWAQEYGRLEGLRTQGAAFVYARPGEPTIRVAVSGDVRAPGLYELNETFDLATLVAFSGGPTSMPQQDEVEQRTTVRLLRGDDRVEVYSGLWPDVQGETSIKLMDGDQVQVRLYTRRIRTWRDNVPLFSLGASSAALLIQIINLLR